MSPNLKPKIMIKKLLSIATVCAFAGSMNAQNLKGVVSDGPAAGPHKFSPVNATGLNNAKTSAIAGSCMDTVMYLDYKVYFKATPNSYYVLGTVNTSTSVTGAFTYKNTGTVVVQGLGAAAYKSAGSTSPSIPARLYLYNVNASNMPTTIIDSVNITYSGTFGYSYAPLLTARTLTTNFAVGLKNVSALTTDTLKIGMTGAQTSAATSNKFGEALGFFKVGSGSWLTANGAFGGTNDFEPAVLPIVSYTNVAANFSTPSTVCVNTGALFTNTSVNQGVINNPMFNVGPFAQMWALTTNTTLAGTDSAYTWIYGDGLKDHKTQATHNHTYTTTGTKNDTLIVVINGFSPYGSYCADLKASTIGVNTCPLGINELSGAEGVKVYPNPSNSGRVNLANLPESSDIELINMIGQTVYTEKASGNSTVDVSNFSKGTYFFKITSPNEKPKMVKLILN